MTKQRWTIKTCPWIGQKKYGARVLYARQEHHKKIEQMELVKLPAEVKIAFELMQVNSALWTVSSYTSREMLEDYRQNAKVNSRGWHTYLTMDVDVPEPPDPDMQDTEDGKTDPYGILAYSIGNEDDAIWFDFAIREDGKVIIHSVVNCETGGFIDRFAKAIVDPVFAIQEAKHQIKSAWEWVNDNDITDATGKEDAERFLQDIKAAIRSRK